MKGNFREGNLWRGMYGGESSLRPSFGERYYMQWTTWKQGLLLSLSLSITINILQIALLPFYITHNAQKGQSTEKLPLSSLSLWLR